MFHRRRKLHQEFQELLDRCSVLLPSAYLNVLDLMNQGEAGVAHAVIDNYFLMSAPVAYFASTLEGPSYGTDYPQELLDEHTKELKEFSVQWTEAFRAYWGCERVNRLLKSYEIQFEEKA